MSTDKPLAPGTGRAGGALTRLSSPSLVGRSAELDLLVRATTSSPALALVEGEAGVGKTRLVTELLASPVVANRRALVGRCQPVREPFPLGPVVDALRALHPERLRLQLSPVAGVVGNLVPELAPHLPPPPLPVGDPAAEQHRLWRALVELLGALGPTVLVLEDLHWADEASAEFLRFLVAQQPARLSVVLTYRRDDLPPLSPLATIGSRLPSGTSEARIHLDPMTPAEVQELIGAILATDRVSPEFAAFLHERTGGVPLAVEEVLRLLVDRQDLVRLGGQWARRGLEELAVPHAVRDSVLERVARLGAEAQRLVRAAAVLGVPTAEGMIASVAGLSAGRAQRALVEAVEYGVLQGGPGGYGFRHALAAQAVYDAVPSPQRRELHDRAAQALEGLDPPPVGRLAHHFHSAHRPRKWVRYAEAAADQATQQGDEDTAARFLLEALDAPDLPLATTGRLAEKLGQAALSGLTQGDAIPALRAVLRTERLPARNRGAIRYYLAGLLHQAGDASGSFQQMERAAAELRRTPDSYCRAAAQLAVPTVLDIHVDEHLKWLDRARRAAVRSDQTEVKTVVEIAGTTLMTAIGDPQAPASVRGLAIEHGAEFVRACTNLAFNLLVAGHCRAAEELITNGLRESENFELHRLVGALRVDRLLLRWVTGQWDGLEDAIAEVEEAAIGLPPSRFQTGLITGLWRLAQGRMDEATALLSVSREIARSTGAIPLAASAATGLARIRLAHGDPEESSDLAVAELEATVRKGIWVWASDIVPVAVEALVAAGEVARAREWVDRFGAGVQGKVAPAAKAAFEFCIGLLAESAENWRDAAQWFGEAERTWTRIPRPYDAAQARERRGLSVVRNQSPEGVDLLLGAMSAFEALGATWDRDRVQRSLRRHGVAVPAAKGTRAGYGRDLSPREREVVELAAARLTNAEIAERLFLSPRTVAHHLERAMRKLGVSSRRALRPAPADPGDA